MPARMKLGLQQPPQLRLLQEETRASVSMPACSPCRMVCRYSVFTSLYADDGNHPSEAGTYLEALVVASTISGAPHKPCIFRKAATM